jgi:F420-dependent methylenetetrahydromethanopterin dehydrogenase
MSEEQLLTDLQSLRRAIATALFNQEIIATLARCPHERVVQATLDLAAAEIQSLRDPGLRRLAIGEGGNG